MSGPPGSDAIPKAATVAASFSLRNREKAIRTRLMVFPQRSKGRHLDNTTLFSAG
jgi:hypothetical protein